MIEIWKNLYIGSERDFESNIRNLPEWWVVHACKEPYHRAVLGYSGRGAPRQHPEYLIARREQRLFLNLVDAPDPAYIPKAIMDAALAFIQEALAIQKPCLVHCNLGESRSPSIGLLYLAGQKFINGTDLTSAETEFVKIYPAYKPGAGMRGFLLTHWQEYVTGK